VSATVIPATWTDAVAVSQVIAEAFHDLVPSRWLIADAAARRQIFPAYFRIFTDHALATGIVHTTPRPHRRGAVAAGRAGRGAAAAGV
jgi:hypothetical protein